MLAFRLPLTESQWLEILREYFRICIFETFIKNFNLIDTIKLSKISINFELSILSIQYMASNLP